MTLATKRGSDGAPLHILLVDDDEDSYILTRDLLAEVRGQRYQLDWAKSAQEGVVRAERSAFDACLVDFYLGTHKGDAVIAELRRRKPTVPLILMTSEDSLANDISVMSAGADGYIVKDGLTPRAVERAIRYAVERRRSETALRTSEQRFRGLFMSSMDGVIVTAPNGDVLAANPAAERLFQLTQSQLVARGRLSLIADEDRGTAAELDARLQAGSFRNELSFRRADGTTFIGEISVAAVGEAPGSPASIVVRDVSDRRAAERRSTAAQSRLKYVEKAEPFAAGATVIGMLLMGIFLSATAALIIGGVVIAIQTWLITTVRRQRSFAFSSLAESRTQGREARRALARFVEYVRVDPQTGLATKTVIERAFEQQFARYQRTGEPFTLVLVEISDPESPRREPPVTVVDAASRVLASNATSEDTVCRVNANTFGVLFPGLTKSRSETFVDHFRIHLEDTLRSGFGSLRVAGGAAEVCAGTETFDQLFVCASDDLRHYDRDLASQIAHFAVGSA